jgi:hypothetical protein
MNNFKNNNNMVNPAEIMKQNNSNLPSIGGGLMHGALKYINQVIPGNIGGFIGGGVMNVPEAFHAANTTFDL